MLRSEVEAVFERARKVLLADITPAQNPTAILLKKVSTDHANLIVEGAMRRPETVQKNGLTIENRIKSFLQYGAELSNLIPASAKAILEQSMARMSLCLVRQEN